MRLESKTAMTTALPPALARVAVLRDLERRRRLPRLLTSLRGYDGRAFGADLAAGVTVGLVALPLAMAFAIASGLPPQAGIYCAVVTGFLVSALGGSRTQIAGPDRRVRRRRRRHRRHVRRRRPVHLHDDGRRPARDPVGITGMGAAVRFIPRPVVIGFTNGIAVLIASTQTPRLLRPLARPRCRANSGRGCARSPARIPHLSHGPPRRRPRRASRSSR